MITKSVDRSLCGREYPIPEKGGMGITLYNATGAATAIGQPVMITYHQTAGREVQASAIATSAFAAKVAIALEVIASGAIGYFQTSGECEVLVADTAGVTAGKFLEVLGDATSFIEDGAVRTTVSCAVLRDAVASGEGSGSPVLKTAILIGEQHTIAAL